MIRKIKKISFLNIEFLTILNLILRKDRKNMNIIEAKGLTKKFQNYTAVDHLNISVPAGKLTAYLGTNGAGKSTTIAMLIGTLTPTEGEIYFKGQPLEKVPRKDKKIGVVFQNSILDKELTVWQNLKIRAQLNKNYQKEKLETLMKQTGVYEFAKKSYGKLSGGMRRKVDITRALLNEPEILFLDEPTTGIDIQSRQEIWQLLHQLKEEKHLAIFLTTHYLEEAENADNLYILRKGKLIESGSAQSLKEKYDVPTLRLITSEEIHDSRAHKEEGNEYHFICQNEKEALSIVNQYQEITLYFSFLPTDLNEVFLKLTKEDDTL